jgi:hypothetical protein
MHPNETTLEEAVFVVYDLRDPDAWTRAREQRAAWGRWRSEIHELDNDHIVIAFRGAGGALEAAS